MHLICAKAMGLTLKHDVPCYAAKAENGDIVSFM